MVKGSIPLEDLIIFNIYAPHNRDSKYRRQKLIGQQGERDKSTYDNWRIQHPSISNGRIQQAVNQEGHR